MNDIQDSAKIHILNTEYLLMDSVLPEILTHKVELDMGCGKGAFLRAMGKRYPERLIIGSDYMVGRLRRIQNKVIRENLTNVRLLRVESRHLTCLMLPDQSVDRIHLLCPDPWPKFRHKGNRLICSEFIPHLLRVLKIGGYFHFSSDEFKYFDCVCRLIEKSGITLIRDDSGIQDVLDIKTDFEVLWNSQGKIVHHGAWRAERA